MPYWRHSGSIVENVIREYYFKLYQPLITHEIVDCHLQIHHIGSQPEEAEDNEEEEKENLGGATKYDLPQGCASTVF